MFKILLVEDSPADALLMQKVFEHAGTACSLQIAEDGEIALEILVGATPDSLPNLILLDMNLPRKSGLEVLQTVKGDEDLRVIPVIMLSGSQSPEDVRQAYFYHANSYVTKPGSVEEYKAFLHAFEAYWLNVAVLSH